MVRLGGPKKKNVNLINFSFLGFMHDINHIIFDLAARLVEPKKKKNFSV
jgi:hypothetical protein